MTSLFKDALGYTNKAERIILQEFIKGDRDLKKVKKQKYKTYQHINTAEYFITGAALLPKSNKSPSM